MIHRVEHLMGTAIGIEVDDTEVSDAAVGAAGCALEGAAEYHHGDHLVAFEPHVDVDAGGIRGTAHGAVGKT